MSWSLLAHIFALLDVPASYIMLINRDPIRPRKLDEVDRNDGLLSATQKIYLREGISGLTKGILPQALMIVISSYMKTRLTRTFHAPSGSNIERLLRKVMIAALISTIMSPLSMLSIRLRLQSSGRSLQDEVSYLWKRMSMTDWFSIDVVLPHVIRNVIQQSVQVEFSTPTTIIYAICAVLSMPFLRCHEIAAAYIKPLEDPVIPLARYQDFGHEIVLDSAWHGFSAPIQQSMLTYLLMCGRHFLAMIRRASG